MFCRYCGSKVEDDNRFCSGCGHALVSLDDKNASKSDQGTYLDSVSSVPAWILAFLSPTVFTILSAIFKGDIDTDVMFIAILILAVTNLVIGYIDLKRIQQVGFSKITQAIMTISMLICTPLYLILRAAIVSNSKLKRFITPAVNIVLIIALAILSPIINIFLILSVAIVATIISKPGINDASAYIQNSIVGKYSADEGKKYEVASPLRLIKSNNNTYEGTISLKNGGYDLKLTVEVLFDGSNWRWTASLLDGRYG